MTVVHVAESFASGVYDFVAELTRHIDADHIVVHGMRPDTPKDFERDFPSRVRLIHWQHAAKEIAPHKDAGALFELVSILRKVGPVDIVHLHSSKAGFLGRVAAKMLGLSARTIYTPHGVSFLRKDVSPRKHRLFVTLEKVGARLGGTVVACSRSEAEAFERHGIPARYINNGIDCDTPHPSPPLRTDTTFRIGTIGRITAQKNPKLFNAIASRFLHDQSVEFLWIGEGELRNTLTSKNIAVTGWLTKEEMKKRLDSLDLYLSTSSWEGLPLSVLQAMCRAKPLLLSRCTGNTDLVRENENGYLYSTQEAAVEKITELIHDNPSNLQQMGEHSFYRMQSEFTITKMVHDYLDLYRTIFSK